MRYDSRAWTGEGYDPIKWHNNARQRVGRRGWVQWVLACDILAALALAIGQVGWGDKGAGYLPDSFGTYFVLLPLALNLSPFAPRVGRDMAGDEFEEAARATATRRAYRLLGMAAVLGCGWMAIASSRGWPLPTVARDWMAVGLSLMVIAFTLPVFMAEITTPLPPAREQEDDR